MIIYPPLIESPVPAFVAKEEQEVKQFTISLTHNSAVDLKNVARMYVCIKDLRSRVQGYGIASKKDISEAQTEFKPEDTEILFETNVDLQPEYYYKFQIAYSDEALSIVEDTARLSQLYYSSVAIGKCISEPEEIKIRSAKGDDLLTEQINQNAITYIGVYRATQTEPAYSYRFTFEEVNGDMIQDSGWVTPAAEENTFILKHDLDDNKQYTIKYEVTTVNGYHTSISYPIVKANEYPNFFEGNVIAEQDARAIENGYVNIRLTGTPIQGRFELLRSTDGQIWDTLTNFYLTTDSDLQQLTWKDFSVEHGVQYIYAIRQYTSQGNRSRKLLSIPIAPVFEHMFLASGDKQLCIKYNPKVSSFKNTILENKQDTIGGKHPFFFRNGVVKYKEIPISGLISYLADEAQIFISDQELGLVGTTTIPGSPAGALQSHATVVDKSRTIDLIDYNITAERRFKLAVLEWLNNGEPKLFRSPTEGNYIVRLMNVSLSPNEQLGRMIHSFSATGYECMDNTYDNLITNNILTMAKDQTSDSQLYNYITNGEQYKVEGKLTDIYYITTMPNIKEVAIIVDGNEMYAPTGQIYVPSAETIEIPAHNNGNTLIYTLQASAPADTLDEEFDTMVTNSSIATKTYGAGVSFTKPSEIVYEYISILCYPNDINSSECYVTIDDVKFDLRDTRIREFKNLAGSTQITKGGEVTMYVTWLGGTDNA